MITSKFSKLVGERRTSVSAVSQATGIGRKNLHAFYHDRQTRYDRGTLDKLCEYFGVSVGELLEYKEAR